MKKIKNNLRLRSKKISRIKVRSFKKLRIQLSFQEVEVDHQELKTNQSLELLSQLHLLHQVIVMLYLVKEVDQEKILYKVQLLLRNQKQTSWRLFWQLPAQKQTRWRHRWQLAIQMIKSVKCQENASIRLRWQLPSQRYQSL